MRENHVLMTNQSLTKQTRLLGTEHISNKRRGVFVPAEKMSDEDIK